MTRLCTEGLLCLTRPWTPGPACLEGSSGFPLPASCALDVLPSLLSGICQECSHLLDFVLVAPTV